MYPLRKTSYFDFRFRYLPNLLHLADQEISTPESAVIFKSAAVLFVTTAGGTHPQEGNLNEAILVCQLKLPLEGMYSLVYQKVQSSTGSIVI